LYANRGQENNADIIKLDKIGILIGPEGGWVESEKELFKANNLGFIDIADFTLRAETAAIIAVSFVFKQ
jgi:16S rRNA (uracil1498-N3)-methyltransferase